MLVSVGAFCLSVWGFIELAEDAPEGDYQALEHRILLAFRLAEDPARSVGTWWLPEVGRDVTALGSAVVLTLMTAAVVGFLIMRRRLRTAVLAALATGGGLATTSGSKIKNRKSQQLQL